MAFDQHKNLAIAVVAVAPLPPDTGLTLTVTAGHGVRYPVPPFDVTIWLATEYPNPANAEVARCTAIAGDQLTLVRAQGGTTARLVQVGDLIAESITAQYLQSLEAAIGTTPSPPTLHATTHEVGGSDPIDGALALTTLTTSGNVSVGGNVIVGPSSSADIRQATVDGADTGSLVFCGGGGNGVNRGATVNLLGNESASGGGRVIVAAGDVATGTIEFVTGATLLRGMMHRSGGFSWGTSTDPGAGNLSVADKLVLTHTGGYPGGTTNFLRADGTFALPAGGGGAPALHAATHTPGNTDPIPNVGWTNVANTWTLAQTYSGTADLIFSGTGRVRWGSLVGDPQLKRNAATLELRTGTDSAFATFKALLVASDITTGTLPLARIQFTGSPRLLGRGTAAAGGSEEITLGTGLTMTGTVLSASGGGAPAAHHATHEVGGSDQITGSMNFSDLTTQFVQITGTGSLQFSGAGQNAIRHITADGADTGDIAIYGGGSGGGPRGAGVVVAGNESPNQGGLYLQSGDVAGGKIAFITGPDLERGRMHPSGGFSWGSTTDPGAGNVAVTGRILSSVNTNGAHSSVFANSNTGSAAYAVVDVSTTASTLSLYAFSAAYAQGGGNYPAGTHLYTSGAGGLSITAASSTIRLLPGGALAGTIFPNGGLCWGSNPLTNPVAGAFSIGTGGRPFVSAYIDCDLTANGYLGIGAPTTALTNLMLFTAAGTISGAIQTSGATTIYVTTSDARLKTDRGVLISTDVLQHLTVHAFDWKDGTPGRGVFAQEAQAVAPFAVSVGSDETDDEGRLKQPWGVDYSKFVPDLIAGWQQHAAEIAELKAELALLKGSH